MPGDLSDHRFTRPESPVQCESVLVIDTPSCTNGKEGKYICIYTSIYSNSKEQLDYIFINKKLTNGSFNRDATPLTICIKIF